MCQKKIAAVADDFVQKLKQGEIIRMTVTTDADADPTHLISDHSENMAKWVESMYDQI